MVLWEFIHPYNRVHVTGLVTSECILTKHDPGINWTRFKIPGDVIYVIEHVPVRGHGYAIVSDCQCDSYKFLNI